MPLWVMMRNTKKHQAASKTNSLTCVFKMGLTSSTFEKTSRRASRPSNYVKSIAISTPSFKNVKNLGTLQDYPTLTLNQINESFDYWLQSDYQQTNILGQAAFEDVFGQLFGDPAVQFKELENKFMSAVATQEAFYLFVLFSDAEMREKLKFLCEMSKDTRSSIRIDSLQLLIIRILSSLQQAFNFEVPTKDEVYTFIDASVKQFIERSAITQDTEHKEKHPHSPPGSPSNKANTDRALTFTELWQWCQDVNVVSPFLEAIHSICSAISSKIDLSHKGYQWMLRNSFFSQNSRRSQSSADLGSLLKKWQTSTLMKYLWLDRHPLWSYYMKDLANSLWLEEMTIMEADQLVFTVLEHVILSPRKCIPIIDRMGSVAPSVSNSASNSRPATSTHHSHNHSHHINSTLLSYNLNVNLGKEIKNSKQENNTIDGNTPSIPPKAPRSPRAGRNSVRAQAGEKLELLGIIDSVSIVTWMLACSPATLFSSMLDNEEAEEEEEEYEFSFHTDHTHVKQTLLDIILQNGLLAKPKQSMHRDSISPHSLFSPEDLTQANPSNGSPVDSNNNSDPTSETNSPISLRSRKSFNEGDFPSVPSVTIRNRLYAVNIFWQQVGEKIVHANMKDLYGKQGFVSFNNKINKADVFSNDYAIYNMILMFAQGYRQIPLTPDPSRSYYNLHHTITAGELIEFLYTKYDEFFPGKDKAKTTVLNSGIMRAPATVTMKDNLAIALYKMVEQRVDTALIVNSTSGKVVCGVLNMETVLSELWYRWKSKQYMLSKGAKTMAELKEEYLEGKFDFYVPPPPVDSVPIVTAPTPEPVASIPFAAKMGFNLNLSINTTLGNNNSNANTSKEVHALARNLTFFNALSIPLDSLENNIGLKLVSLQSVLFDDTKKRRQNIHKSVVPSPGTRKGSAFDFNPANVERSDTMIGKERKGFRTRSRNSSVSAQDNSSFLPIMLLAYNSPKEGNEERSISKPSSRMDSKRLSVQTDQPEEGDEGAIMTPETGRSKSTAVTPSAPKSSKGSGSNKKKHRQLKDNATVHQLLQQQEKEAQIKKLQEIVKKKQRWFLNLKVITNQDSLHTALKLMHQWEVTSLHVVSEQGEALGSITLQDICKYLIIQEGRNKLQQQILSSKSVASHQLHAPVLMLPGGGRASFSLRGSLSQSVDSAK